MCHIDRQLFEAGVVAQNVEKSLVGISLHLAVRPTDTGVHQDESSEVARVVSNSCEQTSWVAAVVQL